MKYLSLFIFLHFLSACSPDMGKTSENEVAIINEQDSIPKKSPVQAILHLSDSLFDDCDGINVQATILNRDTIPFEIRRYVIQQAILSLNVTNEAGDFVPSIPPAMPPIDVDEDLIEIKVGEAYLISYNLGIFNPPLPNGKYQVKMSKIPSNSVGFRIKH